MNTKLITIIITLLLPCMSSWAEEPKTAQPPDKLKDALVEMVTSVTKTVGDGKDFVAAQAPEFAKEYLAWELVKANIWMWSVLVVTVLVLGFGVAGLLAGSDKELRIVSGWFIFAAIVLVFFDVSNILDVMKIKTAPKIVLVEYAKSLIK